ncbi:hypothetical protein SRB5_16800 [Streptomyces sp. RB5]|uniref:Lipoprotein n=1 Tax=Streptomyces smaragdinus TaxID=2585196 RepID=A0A7K0CDM4_9ACTN|nr:hypothetical protein [Streptomyces smaragdinus]MQY11561.1 hypothetical protein [Streptomyces smaragdinus]
MHTGLRRAAVAALAVSVLAVTAACGGSDDGKDEGGKPSASAADPKPVEAQPLTQAQVKAALLTAADIPKGWKADKDLSTANAGRDEFQIGTADTKAESCQPVLDALVGGTAAPKPTRGEVIGFTRSDVGPWLMTGVLTYPEKDAKDVMTTEPPAKDCLSVPGDFEGDKATFEYKELTVPEAGDESLGFTLLANVIGTKADPGYTVRYDYAYARVGATVVALTQLSIDKADTSALEAGLAAAVAKAEKAGAKA